MRKRIASCADGTWQDAANNTNVHKLYNSLVHGADQIASYDEGVGATQDPIWKLLGGAFGTGFGQKIKDGYTSIAHVYEARTPRADSRG